MQDKYVGDIGDYVKLGLLRALMEDRKYKLGVAWYRVPDEKDKKDGSKIEYLDRSDLYAELDRELFDHLYRLRKASDEPKTIESLLTVLPGAVSFSESLITADWHENRRESRKKWFARALEHLSGCGIVFADPDNGIVDDEDKRKGKKDFCKQIPLEEVRALARERCAIIYHHNTRAKGGHDREVDRWLDLLGMPAIAVRAKAWSPRTFFVINPDSEITERVRGFCGKWKKIRVHMHKRANPRF